MTSNCGSPDSRAVGTSGSDGERSALLTEIGRNRPLLIWPIDDAIPVNIIDVSPLTVATTAGVLPLYGTPIRRVWVTC